MFSLPDLRTLVAVVDMGGIRPAAQELGRTQSAVSQAVKRLEEAIGLNLLDRSSYRATLTIQGRLFMGRVEALLRQVDGLESFAKILATETEGRLHIALDGAIDERFWGAITLGIPEAFPDTVVELRPEELDTPWLRLLNGEADMALLPSTRIPYDAPPVESVLLGRMRYVNVVHAQCPDWQTLPQIIVTNFEESSPSRAIRPGHRRWRVGNHAMKISLILRGSGWGWVPEEAVKSFLENDLLRTINADGNPPQYDAEVRLYRIEQRAQGPVAQAVWAAANQMKIALESSSQILASTRP